jgi:beta-lactam-binding protein with PASTA domain
MTVTQRFYSTALPAGSVLLQSPAATSHVRRGWNLAVAESLGPQKVAVPDVLGRNEREAILLIRQKGLELGSIAYLPDAQARAGIVLAQDPGPNARGAERPSVSLLLAATAAPVESGAYVMPREIGRSYYEASTQLLEAGLKVQSTLAVPPGAVVTLSSATAPGTVVWQQPPAGARVDAESSIVLSVPDSGATAPAAAATPTIKKP